ncbi:MAG: beta-propeller domain-containing protein [Lachnospiraceae bacterium]|nr:beta-propeller domain-containing protein [Lachnospiraceae bacterium]
MDRREKEILDKIQKQTENIEIPENLGPDRIHRMLEEKKPKKRIRVYRMGALAAACVVIVAGIAVWQLAGSRQEQQTVTTPSDNVINDSKTIATAEDYEQVYRYIEAYQEESTMERGGITEEYALDGGNFLTNGSNGSAADSKSAVSDYAASTGDYSQTNVRQEGVDEGDVVKIDGRYLYILEDNEQEIAIVDTASGNMEKVSSISVEEDYIYEFYLAEEQKKLVAVCSHSGLNMEAVKVITYDIQNPQKPQIQGTVTQSGSYHSSRMSDGYLYLFSDYYLEDQARKEEPETYIPMVNGKLIEEKDIYLPQISQAYMYEVITAVSLEHPSEITDSKALFSKGGDVYVSNENIYFYETEWRYSSNDVTTVRKVSYKNGMLTAEAQGQFEGYLNDSFSIDEYKGYLRVVTTEGETNSVYILDQELEVVGSITGLAEDERVYSARFLGDTGYFVTFRETDPLFSVDLSDPEHPEIIGSLKIPGFSDYLHFYGEDQLLGIGMNVDEETMTTDGVKLSMFDISDPSDVKKKDTYVLENVYSTDVSYDYKAVLIDYGRNIIGFSGDAQGGEKYYLFAYDEESGFVCNMEEEINGNGLRSVRGVYIDDTLYVVQGNIIESYSLKDYQKTDDLIL